MRVLSKFKILVCLIFQVCVTVPQEEVYNYEPSFWGEEEEENPLYHPERVKQNKKTWFTIEE